MEFCEWDKEMPSQLEVVSIFSNVAVKQLIKGNTFNETLLEAY